MSGWQKNEDAIVAFTLEDTRTGLPLDPAAVTVVVTFTKPDASTDDVAASEEAGVWSVPVFFDQAGPWIPRLVVTGAARCKRRLATIHVADD